MRSTCCTTPRLASLPCRAGKLMVRSGSMTTLMKSHELFSRQCYQYWRIVSSTSFSWRRPITISKLCQILGMVPSTQLIKCPSLASTPKMNHRTWNTQHRKTILAWSRKMCEKLVHTSHLTCLIWRSTSIGQILEVKRDQVSLSTLTISNYRLLSMAATSLIIGLNLWLTPSITHLTLGSVLVSLFNLSTTLIKERSIVVESKSVSWPQINTAVITSMACNFTSALSKVNQFRETHLASSCKMA